MTTIPAGLIGARASPHDATLRQAITANDRAHIAGAPRTSGNDVPSHRPPPAATAPAASGVAPASAVHASDDVLPEAGTDALAEILPAERFFWALFPLPPGMRVRPHVALPLDRAPAVLAELAQDQLPVPLDTLHGALIRVAGTDGQPLMLACTLQTPDLTRAGLACYPATLPQFVRAELGAAGTDAFDLSTLNVLIGSFEPGPLRAERRRRGAIGITTLALLLAACIIGLEVRATALRAHAIATRAELARIADAAAPLPPNSDPAADTLGPIGRLEAALHTQQLTHRSVSADSAPGRVSAPAALAALLAAWPDVTDEADLRTSNISVTPSSLIVTVDLAGDPRPFLGALRAPKNWRLVEPSIATIGERTQVTLQFRPEPGTDGGAP